MWQYTWFDNNEYFHEIVPESEPPADFIMPSDIETVRVIYWGEHCLECAVPLCYGNCEHWRERYDKKCRKFYYGIYNNPHFGKFIGSAQLRFYEWGKLWSDVYRRCLSPTDEKKLDQRNKRLSLAGRKISEILKPLSPTCKVSGGIEYFRKRNLERYRDENLTDQFLFQAYSEDKENYNLILEVSSKLGLRIRTALPVHKGWNQIFLNLPAGFSCNEDHLGAVIYPENDRQSELVILTASFVKLKHRPTDPKPAEKIKCVAWDLDNTLWSGILIETENPSALELREGVLDVVRALDERGIIQVVVSKNEEKDVLPLLTSLGLKDYFVGWEINWNSKSENLKSLADSLNININTFCLIDDSSFERNEVKSALPQVRVYDENILADLLNLPEFDVPVTTDGKKRRKLYQMEFKRKQIQATSGSDTMEFLRSCALEIRISRPDTSEKRDRAYELIQRTNQLNLSGRKYSMDTFLAGLNENTYVFSAADLYGEYGQVGYMQLQKSSETQKTIEVVEFAMSCRVAGKYIESALLSWLQKKYPERDILFSGVNTKKNGLLITSLKNIGMIDESEAPNDLILRLKNGQSPEKDDVVHIVDES